MIEVRQTAEFRNWLNGLADTNAVKKITIRIARVQSGLMGDAKFSTALANCGSTSAPAIASTS
ncbi:hypothetical protein [Mesorhizobium sp. AR07]|uniref:hypothetical protein n=1 Tax=Mesorhizobium sp. AR07 TaxID=2865838 RepID=UPI0029E823D3|nr:hypothetical protein [Mesorhizobium sp. AR07]